MNVERVGAELGQAVRASANTISRQVGFTYTGCDHGLCPQTLAQLQREASECHRSGQPFRVSHDHCKDTIYGNALANMAFRFWHDMIHVEYGLDVTLEDELRAGRHHVEVIKQLGYSQDHQTLMWIDTCGQSLYNFLVGEFPAKQMEFTKRIVALATLQHATSLEHAVRMVAHQDIAERGLS